MFYFYLHLTVSLIVYRPVVVEVLVYNIKNVCTFKFVDGAPYRQFSYTNPFCRAITVLELAKYNNLSYTRNIKTKLL